jgi:hypothetical protein
MTKTCFIARGFKIVGSSITFGSPSTALTHLTVTLRPGDGIRIVTALEGSTGHATDSEGLNVYLNLKRELDWYMVYADWTQHVIVQEPLTTALLAELRKL